MKSTIKFFALFIFMASLVACNNNKPTDEKESVELDSTNISADSITMSLEKEIEEMESEVEEVKNTVDSLLKDI